MDYNIEQTVLKNIITNEKYMRKVLPFIKGRYFEGSYRAIFKQLVNYVQKYNKLPTHESFQIELDSEGFDAEVSNAILPNIFKIEEVDDKWLLDATEQWCQDRALYNAIMDSISIIDGKEDKLDKGAIPQILTDALAIGFDTNIGHDYIEDFDARFEFYHEEESKMPFDLELLNLITSGGLINKSLTIFLAGTGVGKSLVMCHCAAANLSMGKSVLYITAEMSEEKIAERIDANLLDVPINEIKDLAKDEFTSKIEKLKGRGSGKLIIKEYPTGQANSSHFRALLNELKLKKQFIPDIIYIDYLNICASARLRGMGGSINSYSYIKAIAEEFRGLAVEFNVPVVSATQTTRSGFANSDPGLEDTSESFGLPATADLMLALVSNEDLERDGQIMVKQLKNRYNDLNYYKRFMVGINKLHMRLLDAESQSQFELVDDTPREISYNSTGDRYGSSVIDNQDEIMI